MMTTPLSLPLRLVLALVLPCLASCAAGGCERNREGGATGNDPANAPPGNAARAEAAEAMGVQARVLVPLSPGRPTHVVVGSEGTIYWVQEPGEGPAEVAGDGTAGTVFRIGASGLPERTGLSVETILDALRRAGRLPARDAGASGHAAGDEAAGRARGPSAGGVIQSLAWGPDGGLYFYFGGGQGRQYVYALGYFALAERKITLLADTAALGEASGMGASLTLARGTLVAPFAGPWAAPSPAVTPSSGNTGGGSGIGPSLAEASYLWLWLRHSDAAVLLRFDATAARLSGTTRFSQPMSFIHRADGGAEGGPRLTDEGESLSAFVGGTLLYLDRHSAMLWRIDRAGNASALLSLADLPEAITAPAPDGRGRVALLAGDARRLSAPPPTRPAANPASPNGGSLPGAPEVTPSTLPASLIAEAEVEAGALRFPALLLLGPANAGTINRTGGAADDTGRRAAGGRAGGGRGGVQVIDRDAFEAWPDAQVRSLQPTVLVPDAVPRRWVAFDSASGHLLRLTAVSKSTEEER